MQDQVIVIAATNRSDVLDPALTRPGRFDRTVQVMLPDIEGRRQILGVHSGKVRMSPDVDMERVARGTPMFSGAELAALINEAAIIATLSGKEFVELQDLEEARDKIRYGRVRRSRRIEEQEREATATTRPDTPLSSGFLKMPTRSTRSPSSLGAKRWGNVLAARKRPLRLRPEIHRSHPAGAVRWPDRRTAAHQRHLQCARWTFAWPPTSPGPWCSNGACRIGWAL